MKAAGLIALMLILSAAFYASAATKESENPDKEMLRMMDLLKDMEMIRQIDVIQNMRKVEPSSDSGTNTGTKSAPATKREASR